MLLLIVLILGIVIGKSAFAVQTQNNIQFETPSLSIIYPKTEFFPQNQAVMLSFDVLNSSFHRLDNSSTQCDFFLVNNLGENITTGKLSYSLYWYFSLDETKTNTNGIYNYYVHCNSTAQNGFVSNSFEITTTGLVNKEIPNLSIIIFLLAITGFLFGLPFWVKFSQSEMLNMIFKRSCWLISIFLMTINTSVILLLIEQSQLNLGYTMIFYLNFFGWGGYLFMMFYVIKFLFDLLELMKDKKNKERYGDDD